jgi:hypothetical protein
MTIKNPKNPAITLALPASPQLAVLLDVLEKYRVACGNISDKTLSSRVFDDSKKVGQLKSGTDLTTVRLVKTAIQLRDRWPKGQTRPKKALKWLIGANWPKLVA